jgi:hypothetical protein
MDKLKEYLVPAQLPFILAFLAWWLLGASWLLQKALRQRPEFKRKGLGPCVRALFLSGLAAAAVAGLTIVLTLDIREYIGWRSTSSNLIALTSLLLAVPTAFLVLYASLRLPAGTMLRISWMPLASVLVAAVVLGTPAFLLGYFPRINRGNANTSVERLRAIGVAIAKYGDPNVGYFPGELPKDLVSLTEPMTDRSGRPQPPLLAKHYLRCPFLPDLDVGYFYFPTPLASGKDKSRVLRACEFTHEEADTYRTMLFATGEARWNSDREFQSLLDANENLAFAAAFRAADANRPK